MQKSPPRNAGRALHQALSADCRSGLLAAEGQKVAVHARVWRKLGVEGRGQNIVLAHGYRLTVNLSQHLYTCAHAGNDRSANENSREGVCPDLGYAQVGFKTVHLSAKGVAPHGGVKHAEAGLVRVFNVAAQQYKPGATAVNGHAVEYALAQGLKHVPFIKQFADGGAFAAGNDQGIDALNILELAHLAGRRAKAGNSGHMLAKGSLKSQNAYAKLRHYQPRSCMRWAEGMVEISMPTMGSPRSREISASMAKSL